MYVGIGAASVVVGRSPATLRRWERTCLIPAVSRVSITRARRYSSEDLANLRRLVGIDHESERELRDPVITARAHRVTRARM
ncbi:MAG: MerR family transcriptional regulator [Gaiellales bacterium]